MRLHMARGTRLPSGWWAGIVLSVLGKLFPDTKTGRRRINFERVVQGLGVRDIGRGNIIGRVKMA
jgi:hypothetical protein